MEKTSAPVDLFRHYGRDRSLETQYIQSRGDQAGSSGIHVPNQLEQEFFGQEILPIQQQMQGMRLTPFPTITIEPNGYRVISYNGRSIIEPNRGAISPETIRDLNIDFDDPVITKFNNGRVEKKDVLIKVNDDGTRTISYNGRYITEPNIGKLGSGTLELLGIESNNPTIEDFNENYFSTTLSNLSIRSKTKFLSEFENEMDEIKSSNIIAQAVNYYLMGKNSPDVQSKFFQEWLNGASREDVIIRLVDKAVQINEAPKVPIFNNPVITNPASEDYEHARHGTISPRRKNLKYRDISNLIICYFIAKLNNVENPYRDVLKTNYPQVYSSLNMIQIGFPRDPWIEFTNVQIFDYLDIVDFLQGSTNKEPPLTRQFIAQLFLARNINKIAFYDDLAILNQIKFGDPRSVYEILSKNILLTDWSFYQVPNGNQNYLWATWRNILTNPTERKLRFLKEILREQTDKVYLPKGFNLDQIISDFYTNQPNRWIPENLKDDRLFSQILQRLEKMKEEGLLKKRTISKL